jgi:hypothetical protein
MGASRIASSEMTTAITFISPIVQRVDPTPIHMTTNRKLALVMGRFAAEDAVKSLQNSHCIPELESVQVGA